MARQPIQAEYTTFIKGLITEASPLTYPENASLEEENFVLNQDGSRSRRFGMDYEDAYALIDTGVDISANGYAVSSHTWSAVANLGDLEFAVVQVGLDLYFFRTNFGSITANQVNSGNKITLTGGDPTQVISATSIYGNYVVVNGTQTVYILSYDISNDIISVTEDRLEIRDLFGVDDGLAIETRPSTISILHRYNLQNQGWPLSIACSNGAFDDTTNQNPVDYTPTQLGGLYPSNADIIWACKLSSASSVKAINSYWPKELNKVIFGSTQAPLGHYVLDVFNRGSSRQTQSGLILTDIDDQSFGGVTTVAAFAGRVFYAVKETGRIETDRRSPNIGTMVFYSRAKDSISTFTQCYTEADPTAEHSFDPVDTDGGFITIPDAGQILKLVAMGQSLFVFCSNGVWEIHGGETSFSATNQNISKTTDIGVASARSIVYAEDKIAYWGISGIYLITRNDLTLRGGNNDLTYSTIQTLFDNIDVSSKEQTIGAYDPFVRTFRWLYRDAVLPNPSFFNKELIYDINLGSFYIFNIDIPSFNYPMLAGYIAMKSVLRSVVDDLVVVDSDPVIVVTDNVVIQGTATSGVYKGAVKYLSIVLDNGTHHFTFSHYRDIQFRDWKSYDGVGIDAAARMLTGYTTGGTVMLEKSLEYIHVCLKRTELGLTDSGGFIDPSSCKMQIQWEWTNSATAGRWSPEFEVYKLPRIFSFSTDGVFDYSYTTIITKNRIRGKGRALSILFKTQPYHNCVLYGWGLDGSAGKI